MASSKRFCWASAMPRLCCRSGLVLSRSIAVWNSACASTGRLRLSRTSPSVLWYWAFSGSSWRASLSAAMPSASRFSERLRTACSYEALAWSFRTSSSCLEAQPDRSTSAAKTRSRQRAAPSLDRVVSALLAFMVVPTYEYECPKCPRVFEVKQRITEPMLVVCERCGGPIHRLLSATPFILKGGGWYVTDYPSESRKKASTSESDSSAAASAPSSPAAEKSSTAEGTTSPSQNDGKAPAADKAAKPKPSEAK